LKEWALKLFPTVVSSGTYDIDYEKLYEKGIRGIIFDIDNTLVEHDAPANDAARGLIKKIHGLGIKTFILSNNREGRVKSFADEVGSEYIFLAHKPSKKGYVECMKRMETGRENTVLIGDQIFTDVLGASNAGIRSILVKRIAFHEKYYIHLKRILEYLILFVWLFVPKKRKKEELWECV